MHWKVEERFGVRQMKDPHKVTLRLATTTVWSGNPRSESLTWSWQWRVELLSWGWMICSPLDPLRSSFLH